MNPTQRDLLELVVGFRNNGRTVPSSGQIAILLGLPAGSQSMIWHALRELESLGFISGVPSTPRGWNCYIRVCRRGYESVGAEPPWSPVPEVRITPIAWRCEACSAAVLDPSKPCPVCRLFVAGAEPVVYEPRKEEPTAC